ncbi:MAG: GGDEF domain-containing protein [Clostridia bacterium]|nr:GGDEF domain-containing protein [Clostridia bacterium]
MKEFSMKKEQIEKLIDIIDSRIALFNIDGENNYISDKLFDILGFDEMQSKYYLENENRLIEYLAEQSIESPDEDDKYTHFAGLIDKDEKYVIIHLFKCGAESFGFVIDKTAQVHKNIQTHEEMLDVQKKSRTDSLTGLLNRSGFEDTVNNSLKMQPQKGILCICDMDNFKLVNDTLGHPVGDKVLKQFAELLKESFSECGVIGRIGGDEFVIFISDDLTSGELSKYLEEFVCRVKDTFAKEYPDMKLSSSIGASMADSEINDYISLYKSADAALYKVKQGGKGDFTII